MADGQRPTLSAQERPERGTRATKRLRREGLVPGVVYGGGSGDALTFKVDSRVLRQVLVDGSALIDLEVGGRKRPVIVKDQQLHPVRDEVMHIDLLEVRLDEKIQTTVGVHVEGVRGGARRQGGRRARAGDPPAQHRGAAHRDPRRDRRGRERHGDRRHHAPLRAQPARGRGVPRRPGGDDHRHGRRAHRGRGARGDRGRDRAGRRGRRADRGRGRPRRARTPRARQRKPRAARSERSSVAGAAAGAAAGRRTGWWSGSGTPATATHARATTWASRWPRWPPSAGGCRRPRRSTAGSSPTGAPGPAGRAWPCCCRRPT